ncbi:hypothetical protein [Winogradskyella eckloniae]|uniref:hypothetical protein n=1 Tax=Winogradskyella eckloniae TaxID=1089306 RepID=UPI0015678218|nr:hypothetical protein [Winogradskyella eckloniae]
MNSDNITLISPQKILEKIIVYNKSLEIKTQKISANIHFSNGTIKEGIPIAINETEKVVLLHCKASIIYINVALLDHVELNLSTHVIEFLTDDNYVDLSNTNISTSLELKRLFKQEKDNIETLFDFELNSEIIINDLKTELEKYQFELFIKVLKDILNTISKDKLGQQALNNLKQLVIKSADNTALELTKTTENITIHINFKTKFKTDFNTHLKDALESKL